MTRAPGGNGDEQVFGREGGLQFRQHRRDLIRLHRQDQNAGEAQYFEIGVGDRRADVAGESRARRLEDIAGDDLFGGDDLRRDEALRERRGHFARAEETDF